MTPKQKFFAMADANDIGVDYAARTVTHPATIDVWAPDGKVFSGGLHVDCSTGALDDQSIDWREACTRLATIIEDGFEPCPDADCDICNH